MVVLALQQLHFGVLSGYSNKKVAHVVHMEGDILLSLKQLSWYHFAAFTRPVYNPNFRVLFGIRRNHNVPLVFCRADINVVRRVVIYKDAL